MCKCKVCEQNKVQYEDQICEQCADSLVETVNELFQFSEQEEEQPKTEEDYQCDDAYDWFLQCRDMRVQMM